MGENMNFAMFMTKKDWIAIFSASCLLILLLLLALIGKVLIWCMIAFFFIICCITFYLAFIKKYSVEDDELADMINDMKNNLFGGNKNV